MFFNGLQNIFPEILFYGKEEKWIRYNKNKGFYVDLFFIIKSLSLMGIFIMQIQYIIKQIPL
jgi:hypothetical protein